MSSDTNLQNLEERENTLSLRKCKVVHRIDPTIHVKSVDIFYAEISIKTVLKSLENEQ